MTAVLDAPPVVAIEPVRSIEWGDPVLPWRYWIKVYPCPITGCWWWGACENEYGYGMYRLAGRPRRTTRASRVMLAAVLGRELLPTEHALHTCDNPPCVNPDHIYLGDHGRNMADKVARGRQQRGEIVHCAVLTAAQVIDLRTRYAGGESQGLLAERFSITKPNVSMIVNGRRWTHVGGPISTRTPRGK